ncbi:hypothetical protein TRFO_25709 [Tritrichomonas foetus]|uniref:Uncharacterized protein n=1 Tax=Tritrichomonas foetus TaxID=1144522 RepID=A0A1J4K985_9EUKA|nr:hypothetical protein TRFO_25709 [Tritrichomonas foetus]|eukprot:OHT06238.1 hypothetical protein TRFO_25709 [Tritrichomonas foetus]
MALKFSNDFPDFINDEILLRASPSVEVSHPHYLNDIKQSPEKKKKKKNQNQQKQQHESSASQNQKSKKNSQNHSQQQSQANQHNQNSSQISNPSQVQNQSQNQNTNNSTNKNSPIDPSKVVKRSSSNNSVNRKSKDKFNYTPQPKPESENENISGDNDSKVENDVLSEKIFYSFNRYTAAAFEVKTQILYKFNSQKIDAPFESDPFRENELNTRAFAFLDEATYVYCTSTDLCVFSEIDGETSVPFNNIIDIRADFSYDTSHFFVLAENKLYICMYQNKFIFTRLLHEDVEEYDFSKLYRVIVSRNTAYVYARNDFESSHLSTKPITNGTKVYCDDDYLYEYVNGNVTSYIIDQQLLPYESINDVLDVWSSNDVVIKLKNKMIRIQDTIYRLTADAIYGYVYDGVISLWSEFDSPPNWLQFIKSNQTIDFDYVRELARESSNCIECLNQHFNDRMSKLTSDVKKLTPLISESFTVLKRRMEELSAKIISIEAAAMNTGATPQMCLNLYKIDKDRAFRAAAKHSITNLLALCNDGNKFMESLQNNQISEDTLLDVAEVFADNLENHGSQIAPLLVSLLLSFDPDNEIVKARIKPLANTILSATVGLFPTTMPKSPLYTDLRRLTHIAMSIKDM